MPLSAEEVSCATTQLQHVQRRMASVGAGAIVNTLGMTTIWHSGNGPGRFAGLVRRRHSQGNQYKDFLAGRQHFAEMDLAFDLLFSRSASLLNPRSPSVPQATLVRRDNGTNMVPDHVVPVDYGNPQGCCIDDEGECGSDFSCPLLLNLELAREPDDSIYPAIPLVINSTVAAAPELEGPFAELLPSATGTGPGIAADRLSRECVSSLTPFDVHVFEILARTLAPSGCYSRGPSYCSAFDGGGQDLQSYNLAIFRGTDPHIYRVDLYFVQYLCNDEGDCFRNGGPVALEFRVNWNAEGELTTGDVRVLPKCKEGQTQDCSAPNFFDGLGIYIVPPIFAGHEEQPPEGFRGAPRLDVTSDRQHQVLYQRINWKKLLANTALNRPPA